MEEKILRSIKRYIPDLVDIAKGERPEADRGSVEVTAAVMLLIATIFLLNQVPRTARIEATIDALIDRLPRELEDRRVNLSDAIPEEALLKRATDSICGAYNTNLLGAFGAIYNTRIEGDVARMGSMNDGPLGALGGTVFVVAKALAGKGKTLDVDALAEVIVKHHSNVLDAIQAGNTSTSTSTSTSSKSGGTAGSKACFVATACFDSPSQPTVVTLRRFREVVLKKHALGRSFVKSYYRISPPLAALIRRHKVLRVPTRIALSILARVLGRGFRLN